MDKVWSWVDKAHRTRLPKGRWYRISLGVSPEGKGVLAQGQLYAGLGRTTGGVSVRFVRVYKDGRPDDATGYQDFGRAGKTTLNISPAWLGMMTPDMALAIEIRPNGGDAVLGNRIYKGYW